MIWGEGRHMPQIGVQYCKLCAFFAVALVCFVPTKMRLSLSEALGTGG